MTNHRALSAVEICNLQDEFEAMKLEVLALREVLEYVFPLVNCRGLSARVINEALTNSEESAKRIKAQIEADVLEEAAHRLFGLEFAHESDRWLRGVCAGHLNKWAE